MAALFPKWTNTAVLLFVLAIVLLAVGSLIGLMVYVRSPINTMQFAEITQPVEFDHRHHVIDDEIDCLYCHRGAETSAYAGVPSTDVCMGCHNQVWNDSPLLELVRESYYTRRPIEWKRVHNVGDFAYFNHSVHVQAGLGCVSCHGRVDLMARVYQMEPLTMGWCIHCHRDPKSHLASAPAVPAEHKAIEYRSLWGEGLRNLEPEIRGGRHLTRLTTCSACHR